MPKPRLSSLIRQAKKHKWDQWIKSEIDERAVLNGCRFDHRRAQHVIRFFEDYLCLSKGAAKDGTPWAGQPFKLMPWQHNEVLCPLFGWVRNDGRRRFRAAYIEVPKKSGKSPLAAGVGNYLAFGDGEPGARVYSVATKLDQARIVHDEAVTMVKASPTLKQRLTVHGTTSAITHARGAIKSIYRALAAEAKGVEGLDIHGLIIDELHVWDDQPFYDALAYAMAARANPIRFEITTAGEFSPQSIGWRRHEYAMKVRDGVFTNRSAEELLVYITAADKDDDWEDPEVHRKANPSYNIIIDPEEMMTAVDECRNDPLAINRFKRYRLNVWTESFDRMIPMDSWDACAEPFDPAELIGRECWGGLDLAQIYDLNALALVFPWDDGFRVLMEFFAPREYALDREKRDGVPYVTWANQGLIELTEGPVADYRIIRKRVVEASEKFGLRQLAVDRGFQGLQLCTELGEEDGIEVVPFGQGFFSMAAPVKQFMRLVKLKALHHGGNAVLRWMASNCVGMTDPAGNIKPDKKHSTDRIDGVVAVIMGIGQAMLMEGGKKTSVYDRENRGPISVNMR